MRGGFLLSFFIVVSSHALETDLIVRPNQVVEFETSTEANSSSETFSVYVDGVLQRGEKFPIITSVRPWRSAVNFKKYFAQVWAAAKEKNSAVKFFVTPGGMLWLEPVDPLVKAVTDSWLKWDFKPNTPVTSLRKDFITIDNSECGYTARGKTNRVRIFIAGKLYTAQPFKDELHCRAFASDFRRQLNQSSPGTLVKIHLAGGGGSYPDRPQAEALPDTGSVEFSSPENSGPHSDG